MVEQMTIGSVKIIELIAFLGTAVSTLLLGESGYALVVGAFLTFYMSPYHAS